MKYLKRYEDFEKQEYAVGDVVQLTNGEIGKIVKISSKYSYIVNIMMNHAFLPKPVQKNAEDIVEIVQSNSYPAVDSDTMQKSQTNPSNDMVINGGYPDTPVANTGT